MDLWRIFPSADPGDPRWQDRDIREQVVVRAPSAAMARLLAGRAHATGTHIGNESSGSRGAFQDEKLYWVARIEDNDAAIQGSGPAAAPPVAPSSEPDDDLMHRTVRKRVTFPRPFPVIGLDDLQAAGTYSVEIEEELLEGLSFVAYRRLSTNIILPPRPDNPSMSQLAQIDPGALDQAVDEAP